MESEQWDDPAGRRYPVVTRDRTTGAVLGWQVAECWSKHRACRYAISSVKRPCKDNIIRFRKLTEPQTDQKSVNR